MSSGSEAPALPEVPGVVGRSQSDAVADLPEAWNAKVKEYLGLDVPSDRLGVLQDVHWSSGQVGTFCNYTIGNVMAGQLFHSATQDARVREGLASANYLPLRGTLQKDKEKMLAALDRAIRDPNRRVPEYLRGL